MSIEDAEDGAAQGLQLVEDYDTPPYEIVFDTERNSQVLEFQGNPISRYEIKHADGEYFNEASKLVAQWSTKGTVRIASWAITTDVGVRHIDYSFNKRLGCQVSSNDSAYVNCGLDMSGLDGNWHNFTRNLEVDLKSAIPNATLEKINSFIFRAGYGGRVDDIKLLESDTVATVTISGYTTLNGQPASGVNFSQSGAECQTSDHAGYYQCTVPQGWFGTLVPEKTGYQVIPFSRVYLEMAENHDNQNFELQAQTDDVNTPIIRWTRDMHPTGDNNGAVHLPNEWGDYVDDHFTLMAKVKPTLQKSRHYIFHANDDYPGMWLEGKNNELRALFIYRPNGSTKPIPTSVNTFLRSEPIPLNEWTELAATWNGSEYIGYVNGQPIGKVELPNFIQGGRIAIGWDGGRDRAFVGDIAEVSIYKRALTAEEIAALYNQAFDCSLATNLNTEACEALVKLYENTNGDAWNTNTGWLQDNDPCAWHGISCEDGEVVGIRLDNNNLDGELPPALEILTEMGVLSASGNKLEGDILPLNKLTHLQTIDLSNNQLTGAMPNLDTLTNLTHLDVSDNKLTGNYPALDGLTQLENIFLDDNQFSGALPDFNTAFGIENITVDEREDICLDPSVDYSGFPQFADYPICTPSVLTINKRGSGSGSVTSDDGNITCDNTCSMQSFNYSENILVTLDATPDAGSVFQSWSGSCRGTEPSIQIQMSISKTCMATFDLERDANSRLLEVMKMGDGRSTFSIKQAGEIIKLCGDGCISKQQSRFVKDSMVDLSVRVAAGSEFIGWKGACEGETASNISVLMDESKSCMSNVMLLPEPPQNMVRVTVNNNGGSGSGTIKVLGIYCGGDCEDYIEVGRTIGLKAEADTLSKFHSWRGNSPQCEGKTTPYLQITPFEDISCIAVFDSVLDETAEEYVQYYYEHGYLSDGKVLSEEYPPTPVNELHLFHAYRLALNALLQVDEHLTVTGQWPAQFENVQRYIPEPARFYVETIKIQSQTTLNLLNADVTVVGHFVRVDVVLEHKDGEEELVPILIYYGDEPVIIAESLVPQLRWRGRRGRRYGLCPRRRRW
ncbi:LamG-like jellyroll fold domain-containing protein [Candidatus Albibeggiatoa sp. nov. BB20]|uniref:LamG-like jellyroll fold domain-containing protein n=1 Tax=Candidatus Albibeggiatoa sp. nov. BB20 TaxID=3162723 RepID=UPI0033654E3E